MGDKASTIFLHLDLSCLAACYASSHVSFISFNSGDIVHRHAFWLGPPLSLQWWSSYQCNLDDLLLVCSEDMPQPSHSAEFYFQYHIAAAWGFLTELFIGNFLRPEDGADFPEARSVEGDDFLSLAVTLQHSILTIQQHQFYIALVWSDVGS